jgi:hypothetical protein
MLSHFLAENPHVIDQLGASSLAVLGSVADIMQNPTMDSGEKSVTLSAALRDNLVQIGQALIATLMSWIGADGARATVHLAGQLVI